MKKLLSIVLALAMLLTLTTVAASAETADEGTWKVAILTGTTSQGEEEFRAAEKALEKYGPEHIITDTYPDNFMSETETTISKLVAFASDPDVKAIVMCQAVPGATPGIQKIRAAGPAIVHHHTVKQAVPSFGRKDHALRCRYSGSRGGPAEAVCVHLLRHKFRIAYHRYIQATARTRFEQLREHQVECGNQRNGIPRGSLESVHVEESELGKARISQHHKLRRRLSAGPFKIIRSYVHHRIQSAEHAHHRIAAQAESVRNTYSCR